ncbi:MAG: transcription termination factor NusA [Candidatus Magasanikbacteria bacterium]|jgi:N utilization substance protein A
MSDITKAIQLLCDEKNLSFEAVMETIETALAAAYRKDFGNKQQNIKVKFDPETADMKAWDIKTVVEDIDEEVLKNAQEEMTARREKARAENRELTEEETADLPHFNPKTELMLSEAKKINKKTKVGEVLEIVLEIPGAFGRMAAQTAKQVIIQKVREAERNMVFGDFKGQEGQIIMGTIQRAEGHKVLVDLGKVTGLLLGEQQIKREHYRPGARMKFFVLSVNMGPRGPEVLLSRSSSRLVEEIFKQEIPEIESGVVKIKGVARDAGYRSKVSVQTDDEAIDPVGACIGQRGSRINTIIEELGGEKIDIIEFKDDASAYISKALSPAKVSSVELNDAEKTADVLVTSDQFSLAIGRNGQNVRLASEMTGWRINLKDLGGAQEISSDEIPVEGETAPESVESKEE